jgi:hypothetical protein
VAKKRSDEALECLAASLKRAEKLARRRVDTDLRNGWMGYAEYDSGVVAGLLLAHNLLRKVRDVQGGR